MPAVELPGLYADNVAAIVAVWNALGLDRPVVIGCSMGGRVVVRATRANAFYAALQVSDTGIGIAEEDREKIFERFYRTDKARNRREGGTGLGLSIVQWIAESHGGKIEVESASGRGSTFTVYLPRRQGEKRQVPLGSLPDPRMLHPEQMH